MSTIYRGRLFKTGDCTFAYPRYHKATDMDEFLKMDIFFVVTTVAVVAISILLAFVLIRVLRILKNIEDISVMVEAEGEKLRGDIAQVRQKVHDEGLRVSHMLDFLGTAKPKRSRKKSSST